LTLSLVFPASGSPMGYGIRLRVSSDAVGADGDILQGLLFVGTGLGGTDHLARADSIFSLSSGQADLVWGLQVGGSGELHEPGLRETGLALGSTISVYLQHYSPSHVFIEEANFDNEFVHDPLSQAPWMIAKALTQVMFDNGMPWGGGLTSGQNTKLNEIDADVDEIIASVADVLAAVQKTWP
jgi:hypothetical protein